MNCSTSKWQAPGFLGLAKLAAGLCMFVLLLTTLSSAQSTGTVTGTVADQSGAVVAKAKISVKNEGTGDVRETTSNDSGYFSFGTVNPGAYTVKVTAANFKSFERKGVVVRPGDVRDVRDIALQVGTSSDVIEVTGVADEIAPVDSGERSSVLTSKQIDNLSLEGRDATELIRTLPGFASFNGGGIQNQGQDFTVISPTGGAVGQGSVAGGQPYRGGTDLTMDGAHILDNGCNCGATTTVNGDMVSEVKVQTSNFGADSAKGPVVVNVIGKSGTTSWHGEAYAYARDGALNSLDWAFKRQQITSPKGLVPSPASRFLYPGAQIGGPIPGTNKKLVFTTAFEYYYQHGIPLQGPPIPGLLTDSVPTLSMRAGNFSSTGINNSVGSTTGTDNADLCKGLGFPGVWSPTCADLGSGFTYNAGGLTPTADVSNAPIPSSLFDPGAMAILAQVPLPNANPLNTGGFNYLQPENLDQNGWMWRTRADYNASENTKFYGTYQVQRETDNVPVHLWWQPANSIPFPGGMSSKDNSQTISGHFVKIISPTLTNEVSTGIGYINYPLTKNSKTAWDATANNYQYNNLYGNPSGGTYSNKQSNMMPQIGNGYWLSGVPQMIQPDIFQNGGHFLWQKWNYSLEDNLTKSYKTHTVKTGFYWEKTVNNQGAFTDLNGNFQPSQSGPFGSCDFLPGSTSAPGTGIRCGSNNPVANLLLGVGGYDQVNKSALDNVWYPTYSGYVQDDWKASKRLTLNLGLRLDHLGAWRSPNAGGVATYLGTFNNTFENSLSGVPGFSWHGVDPSLPLTGRDVPVITWQPRLGLAYDLRGNGKTVLRGGWGEYGYRDQYNDYQGPSDLAQGSRTFGSPDPYQLSWVSQLGVSGGAAGAPGAGTGIDLADHHQPLSTNYNFTISQQLPFSSLIEVGYVGSQTNYGTIEGNTNNLDARNVNVIQSGALFGVNWSGPGTACTSPLSSTNAHCNFGSNGIPLAAFPLASIYNNANVQVERHLAKTDYNSLQASWLRQKGRFTYNFNYTWQKTLGTQGTAQLNGLAPDALNLSHDYGVLSIDRSHVFNFTYTLETGNPLKGAAGYVTNGWHLSGITTWQSGPDITTLGSTNLGLGGNGPATPSGGYYGISAVNYLGTNNSQIQPIVKCNPTAGLKAHQYFNASCFSVGPPGQNGNWQLPYIHGPAYFNSDLALFKTFKVTERQNVEFRISGFNFLNHPLDSFQNNGDNTIGFNYEGTFNGAPCGHGAPMVACPLGSGAYVLTSTTSQTGPGGPVHSGYASTRFGRRVLELSAKYRF